MKIALPRASRKTSPFRGAELRLNRSGDRAIQPQLPLLGCFILRLGQVRSPIRAKPSTPTKAAQRTKIDLRNDENSIRVVTVRNLNHMARLGVLPGKALHGATVWARRECITYGSEAGGPFKENSK